MSVLSSIIQLVVALSVLIILHEFGHFLAARLMKVNVEEFGLGFPPQAKRLWRGKSKFMIGSTEITVPMGRHLIQDLEAGQWADIITKSREADGTYILQSITILNTSSDDLEVQRKITPDGLVHMRGEITSLSLNTLYSLNWLPLGGFVRLKGEVDDQDSPGGLHAASPWARLLIYFAGPLMNLLVGALIFAFMYAQTGAPDLTKVLVVGISPGSPAEQVGLQDGDIITYAAGEKITSTEKLSQTIYSHLGEDVDLTFMRGEEVYEVSLVPRENPPEGEGAIGIFMSYPIKPVGFFDALPFGAQATYYYSLFLVSIPGEVIRGAIEPSLARPVGYKGIYDAYQYVQQQEEPVPKSPISLNIMRFFASISISLGMLNLLPIPALDGGRILFTLPEIVIRRRIPIEWQNVINMISITALIALFLYINLLDFTNPIQFP